MMVFPTFLEIVMMMLLIHLYVLKLLRLEFLAEFFSQGKKVVVEAALLVEDLRQVQMVRSSELISSEQELGSLVKWLKILSLFAVVVEVYILSDIICWYLRNRERRG